MKNKKDYKKLYKELKIEFKDVEETLERSTDSRLRLREEKEELEEENKELSQQNGLIKRRFDEVNKSRLYIEGQLDVLKRLSRLYPEQQYTPEEYRQLGREILTSNPEPTIGLDHNPYPF